MAEVSGVSPEFERTVALAAVFQAAELVYARAHGKHEDQGALRTSIASVLRQDAPSVLAIYGGDLDNLRCGFECLLRQLGRGQFARFTEVSRYASELLALERQLMRRDDLVQRVQQGVRFACNQVGEACDDGLNESSDLLDDAVLGTLAQTYKDTLSHLRPRIMVRGDPAVLSDTRNADCIRAILLAGIRSAVLWRQLGGSRRWMLFKRKELLRLTDATVRRLRSG